MSHVHVVATLGARLGESPVWDSERQMLHLLDIFGKNLISFDPASGGAAVVALDGVPGALALRDDGGFIGGIGLDVGLLERDGQFHRLATATAGDRFNDGKCDPRGRFIIGTMDQTEQTGGAALYAWRGSDRLNVILSGLTLSNGLDWSPSGECFYHVDTPAERIAAFDYDLDTGALSNCREFVDLREVSGRPDGLTVDDEGGVWVVMARAGEVRRYDERGRLDQVLQLPTAAVTSCAFGGENLDQLYVTSSRDLLPSGGGGAANDVAGALFVVEELGVRGRAPFRYAIAETIL